MRRRVMTGRSPTSISPLLSLAGALLLAARPLCAQSPTGRIEGQVRDATGAPLHEAQVYIPGTTFGALTDPRGHYFINHVPSGRYNLRAAYVGYRPIEARDLQVLAGQSATQDFALELAPLLLRDIEVVAAANLLVPRDEVTTRQRVQGDFLERSPVDERARIEEAHGKPALARDYYREFLLRYDMPRPKLRHLVDEANTALRRLSGQGAPQTN